MLGHNSFLLAVAAMASSSVESDSKKIVRLLLYYKILSNLKPRALKVAQHWKICVPAYFLTWGITGLGHSIGFGNYGIPQNLCSTELWIIPNNFFRIRL